MAVFSGFALVGGGLLICFYGYSYSYLVFVFNYLRKRSIRVNQQAFQTPKTIYHTPLFAYVTIAETGGTYEI